MKTERLIILALVATLIATIGIAYAVTIWNGTISWSNVGTRTFEVYSASTGGTPIPTPYNVSANFGENIRNFWVENTGNVPITVLVIEGTEVGCVATWNPISIQIPVDSARTQMILTLNVASNTGSYTWTLNVS